MGRTEDVKFSPDGRRLVIARFNCNKILILEVDCHCTETYKIAFAVNVAFDILQTQLFNFYIHRYY